MDDLEKLIDLIDKKMASGSNSVNVINNGPDGFIVDEATVVTGLDKACADSACKIPNLNIEGDN